MNGKNYDLELLDPKTKEVVKTVGIYCPPDRFVITVASQIVTRDNPGLEWRFAKK